MGHCHGPPLEALTTGLMAYVCAGHYEGKPVAVKVTKPYHKAHHMYSKELRILQEVWAYQETQKMPEIAGKMVSKLHAFLRLPNETFVLVVDRQQQSLSDYMDEHGCVPEELKERLLASLRVLHSNGVVHGSPRFDNVTVKPGSQDICWIDLQRTLVHKYTWRTNPRKEVYDISVGPWREKTHDEQLAEGAEAMAEDILEQLKLKAQEYQYVSRLLDADYSQLDKDCASHQRSHFSRSYNA